MYSKYFSALAIGSILTMIVLSLINKSFNGKKAFILIICLGIALRVCYGMYNNFSSRQHDTGWLFTSHNTDYINFSFDTGHYGYIGYLFTYLKLPTSNVNQLYHPPLHHIIQALFMRFNAVIVKPSAEVAEILKLIKGLDLSSLDLVPITVEQKVLLERYIDVIFNMGRILTMFYSSLIVIIVYYILKELKLPDKVSILILLYVACQPLMIMMTGFANNDLLSYLFVFLTLYLGIKWLKKPNIFFSIALALAIGLGMISKLSATLIAVVIAPIMIYKFVTILISSIKEKKAKPILLLAVNLLLFAVIVFPLGLSYALRNLKEFNQPLTYVWDLGVNSWLYVGNYNLWQRIGLPSFSLINQSPFHVFATRDGLIADYNIWLDMIKTSTYGEWGYAQTAVGIPMYYGSLLLALGCLISVIYLIVILIKERFNLEHKWQLLFFASISLLFIIAYLTTNLRYQHTCTSNFRYAIPLGFAMIGLLSLAVHYSKNDILYKVSFSFISVFSVLSCILILVI